MTTDGMSGEHGSELQARRLWLQLVESEARYRLLETRLAQLQASRSWRLTAPLRALVAGLSGSSSRAPARPPLGGATTATTPGAWPRLAAEAMDCHGGPSWPVTGGASARYLVDVTELALEDLGAGVQRITRSWLCELLIDPPAGHVVEPVRLDQSGHYVLARVFLARFLGLSEGALGLDALLRPGPEDVFVGLDFCRDRTPQLEPALVLLKASGVRISLVVPDVLPLQHPEWFPPGIATNFEAWLRLLAAHADAALCISRDCAHNLRTELAARQLDAGALATVVVPLGSDLPPATLMPDLPPRRAGVARLLMVGTLEPRKGYSQALDAFDLLNRETVQVEFFIVGHAGWMTEALARRIRSHALFGQGLYWWQDADDATLLAAYRNCDLLVMASLGEGYGLPIGEAARAGCALLLRDLPVFREVAGDAASFFSGESAQALASAVEAWIASSTRPVAASSGRWPSWRESAVSMKNETIPSPRRSDADSSLPAQAGMSAGQAFPHD